MFSKYGLFGENSLKLIDDEGRLEIIRAFGDFSKL